MKFDDNLSSIHAYLCGDGYVIRNKEGGKRKFYVIGFRNTNLLLLKDFQFRFKKIFGFKPVITKDLDRCKIHNKDIYFILTKDYSYYSREWEIPFLSKNKLCFWLKSFFDCEAWVENRPAKSRLIGLDCCNQKGLFQVKESLKRLGIKSSIRKKKNRNIWSLVICGLDNLKIFKKNVSFLHPKKERKLKEAIDSYVNYRWEIPLRKKDLFKFMALKACVRPKNLLIFHSIMKINLLELKKALNKYGIKSKLKGPLFSGGGSKYYRLNVRNEK